MWELHCELVPNVLARPTLFIHGNFASNRWWHPVLAELVACREPSDGAPAILGAWAGCGWTPKPAEPAEFSLEKVALSYGSLLERLALAEPVMVVGHSSGGLIALHLAHLHPELVGGLVLLNSVGIDGLCLPETVRRDFARMASDRAHSDEVILDAIFARRPDGVVPRLTELLGESHAAVVAMHEVMPEALAKGKVPGDPSAITQRALVLHGQLDKIIAESSSERLAVLLPNAAYLAIPGHGHSLNIERPTLFAAILKDFLAEERKSSPCA